MTINTKLYIEEYLKIRTKESEIVPFVLNAPQMKLYNAIKEQAEEGKPQRIIVLKARQMGFSTLTEAIIFKKTATAFNVSSAIATQKDDATTNLFEMSKRYYQHLPDELKPQLKASNAKELIFGTADGKGLNSRIKCFTAGGGTIGRSDTLQNLHVSEYAFWTGDKKLTLAGLLQAVSNSPNTLVVIESTANGFDHFKELWDMAVAGESDFTAVFCAWWELPEYRIAYDGFELTAAEHELKALYGLDNEQIAWRRWAIANNCGGDEKMFKQEYPANPHEAFLSTGTSVFNNEQVIAQLEKNVKPIRVGSFEYRVVLARIDDNIHKEIRDIKFVEDERGCVRIYKEPEAGYPYVIGGDTAGDGSDNFTGQVINNVTCEQSAVLTMATDEDLYAMQMYCLGKHYNTAMLTIEANFSTHPIRILEELRYPKLYQRQRYDENTKAYENKTGFRTDSITRPVMIAETVQVFRDNPALVVDSVTLNEMLTFVKNDRGKPEAMPKKHDDHVMGLALAYASRGQQTMVVREEKPQIKKLPFGNQGGTKNVYMEW